MPVCGNYLFFELPKKIVLNPKDGSTLKKCSEFCTFFLRFTKKSAIIFLLVRGLSRAAHVS